MVVVETFGPGKLAEDVVVVVEAAAIAAWRCWFAWCCWVAAVNWAAKASKCCCCCWCCWAAATKLGPLKLEASKLPGCWALTRVSQLGIYVNKSMILSNMINDL